MNFKSIAAVSLDPTQLTVLVGSNSSGKSSLLQSALFFAQSCVARATVINGDLVRLGEPSDVIRNGMDHVAFELEFSAGRLQAGGESEKVACRVVLGEVSKQLVPKELLLTRKGVVVLHAESTASPVVDHEDLRGRSHFLRIQNAAELDLPDESFLLLNGMQPFQMMIKAVREDFRQDSEDLLVHPLVAHKLETLRDLLDPARSDIPMSLASLADVVRAGNWETDLASLVDEAGREDLLDRFFERAAPEGWVTEVLRRAYLSAPFRRTIAQPPQLIGAVSDAAQLLSAAVGEMDDFARLVTYLGPLRDDPRVAYALGHTVEHLPVGEKGEFTASYLEQDKWRSIQYFNPEQKKVSTSLHVAVSDWCRYLQIADRVAVESKGKLGHEVTLEIGGQHRDPTAIGVGASQLLPVIVAVLGARPGQIVLLEQPELHLHPKVQSRLGDFFAFARPDVRILIETHSEYLITRLRLRIAQRRFKPSKLAVKFVSQSEVSDGSGEVGLMSDFHTLALNELGDFEFWPQGFFDSLDNDNVALADAITTQLARGDDSSPSPR